MKFRIVIGVSILVIVNSCAQRKSKDYHSEKGGNTPQVKFKSGLTIKNDINRGINYTDSLGTDYSIRYIPITVANDSTIPIQFQINFLKEYDHPHPDSDEKFMLIPMAREWGLEQVDITESMLDELPKYIEKPAISLIIEPSEEVLLPIGSIYPRPAKTTGVLPRTLFLQSDSTNFLDCEWLMENNRRSNQQIPLGLKTIFGEQCLIIPCGKISYLEQ